MDPTRSRLARAGVPTDNEISTDSVTLKCLHETGRSWAILIDGEETDLTLTARIDPMTDRPQIALHDLGNPKPTPVYETTHFSSALAYLDTNHESIHHYKPLRPFEIRSQNHELADHVAQIMTNLGWTTTPLTALRKIRIRSKYPDKGHIVYLYQPDRTWDLSALAQYMPQHTIIIALTPETRHA